MSSSDLILIISCGDLAQARQCGFEKEGLRMKPRAPMPVWRVSVEGLLGWRICIRKPSGFFPFLRCYDCFGKNKNVASAGGLCLGTKWYNFHWIFIL